VIAEACSLQARIGTASKQEKKPIILLGDFNMEEANKSAGRAGFFWTHIDY
jgi:endonuclease/exonuclease/phosphatase family metal-dependent hydrolase